MKSVFPPPSRAMPRADRNGEPKSWCSGLASRNAIADGRTPSLLQRGLRRQIDRRSQRRHRVLRGAARAAVRFPLERPCGLQVVPTRTRPAAIGSTVGRRGRDASRIPVLKTYGFAHAPWTRSIRKPVAGSVLVSVGETAVSAESYDIDYATGIVAFKPGHIPSLVNPSPRVSSSMSRSASTPTSSRSICRGSATAPSRTLPSSR